MSVKSNLFSIPLEFATKTEILTAIETAEPVRIATVNPEFMLEARRNPAFKTALQAMDYRTVDGSGLKMALSVLCNTQAELYPGATLVQDLFEKYQDGKKSFYLLGDKPGVATTARTTLAKLFHSLSIVGAEDGGILDPARVTLDPKLIDRITAAKPDILLVGFGMVKQELWIQAAANLPVPVMIGVGGTFGFYGTKKRAPTFWQTVHLEWLYRSFTETGHAKRAWQAAVVFPLSALWWRLGLAN